MKKELTNNQQVALNTACGVVVFAAGIIMNFFLSPYLVKTLGVSAKGFASLASNFVSYASIVTVSLNTMSSRFITIKVHQGDYEGASRYYSSVFACNVIMLAILFIPAILCVAFLDSLINIPPELVTDVKILFSLVFASFYLCTGLPKWQVAVFATNKLHLAYVRDLESNLIKIVMLIGMFSLLSPHVCYIGIATCVTTVFVEIYSYYYKRQLLPQLHVSRKHLKKETIKELLSSSIWVTLSNSGSALMTGLDLVITNLFIGDKAMGMVSVSKTIPEYLIALSTTIQNIFMPNLTIFYAKNDINGLIRELKKGMSLTSVVLTLPLAVVTVFGREFYMLWQPTLDANVLYVLSLLAATGLYFTSGVRCVSDIFTITNKVKPNALMQIICGAVSTVIVLLLLKFTGLGMYAVAGVSTFCLLVGNMVFTLPYSAKCLGLRKRTFFPNVFKSLVCVGLICVVGVIVRMMFSSYSWFTLALAAAITCAVGFVVNFSVVLSKSDRDAFIKIVRRKLKK